MKTKEEIEQLATKHYRSNGSGGGQYTEGLQEGRLIGYVDGYTQCQEDIKPLLKDLWDLWERLAEVGELHIGKNFTKKYEELKNSLNKQD